jgi:hypothetical protein
MQAPDLPNKRYVVYLNKLAEAPHYMNYATFDEAWAGAKMALEEYNNNGGSAMRLLHSSASECMAANPDGRGGSSFVKRWIWADWGLGDSETKRCLGDGIIIEFRW